jgi:hypothetical protein
MTAIDDIYTKTHEMADLAVSMFKLICGYDFGEEIIRQCLEMAINVRKGKRP